MAFLGVRFKRRFSRIGVDLGTSHLKIVQFKQHNNRVYLHRCGLIPLPDGTVEQGRIINSKPLVEQLETVIKQLRFEKKTANICIDNQNVILRTVTLPRMLPKEIPGAIQWELEKHITLPADEVTTDYIFHREVTVDGNQVMEVKLVAAPREIIKGYLDVVAEAGINPEVVEIEPFSLNRAVCFFSKSGAGADNEASHMVLLVDIGHGCSNLLIMENGEYAFSHSLHMGVKHLCSHVAAINNITIEEASGLVFGSDPFSVPGFRDIADELAEMINSSAEYYIYRVKEKNMNFHQILLCGGGSAIKDMGSFLSGNFDLEAETFNVFDYIDWNNDNSNYNVSGKEKLLFGVAGGLALRGWAINEKRD